MDVGTEVAPPVAEHPAAFRLTWYEYNDLGLFPVPGKVIKQETVNKVSEHWVNANPYWYDPQYYVHVYEYQVTLADPWNQIQNGRYFLSIEALYDSLPKMVQWGWMNTSEKSTPSAVAIDVADWYELVWPEGHPFFGSPMNMSFALTVPEPTPEPTLTPAPTRTLVPTPSISPVPTISLTPSPSFTPAPTPCMMQVGILPAASGPWINERDLRRLLQLYVPDYQSMILAFTQCYGGAFTDSFTDFPRTSILSATMAESPWELSYYGGYHDDAARAVSPGAGRAASDIHNAGVRGKNGREHPVQAGVPVSLESASPTGLIQGRNIVVYGGQPNNMDFADFSNISSNFLGQPNTMVLGLGGAPAAGWNFAATLENLTMTLSGHVRPRMDANRQFILFITDHGGLSLTPCEVPATAVFSTRTILFPFPLSWSIK